MSDWFSEPGNWWFLLLGIPMLVGAARAVTSPNIVRAVAYFVLTLGGLAGMFLLLGAEFVAWTLVLVYIGAVIVLFLIGIMITRAPLGRSVDLDHSRRWPAALISLAVFAAMSWASIDFFGDEEIVPEIAGRTGDVGESIFTRFVIPFEVVSFVLLAALIGGIVLARRDPESEEASE
jgi:NADH-quinone oxidoreductase subunit J